MSLTPQAFCHGFVPRWLDAVREPSGSVLEELEPDGRPSRPGGPSTTLVQARSAFALAHLGMAAGKRTLIDAALAIHRSMDDTLRSPEGGYRVSTGEPAHRSYDQSFALLALIALDAAAPGQVAAGRIDALVDFIDRRLTDPFNGTLLTDDISGLAEPRAQNPHMHMLEAYLQALELTGDARWLRRAERIVTLALEGFLDRVTGAIVEFAGADLTPLRSAPGRRVEPGHQFEWAWLLERLVELGGDPALRGHAARMVSFAERFGMRADGPLAGAPFDAIDTSGRMVEDTHLLWPLTELGKYHSAVFRRSGEKRHAARARQAAQLVFGRYFATSGPAFVNRFDGAGRCVWPSAPSRLVYHVALLVTEGERAGLWRHEPQAPLESNTTMIIEEETS